MFSSSLLAASIAVLASTITAAPAPLSKCGGVIYDPTMYTCGSDEPVLCPIIYGNPYANCGEACYDVHMYQCTNGSLSTLPTYDGPFTLRASNLNAPFNGQYLAASGGNIFIGKPQSTYCPPEVSAVEPCPSSPDTVFLPGALGAIVPGGQHTFIQTNGALAFTEPHSASEPNDFSDQVTVYGGENGGGYFGPGGVSWVACPAGNATSVYQVYAALANITFPATCTGFDAIVQELPETTEGAWEYI